MPTNYRPFSNQHRSRLAVQCRGKGAYTLSELLVVVAIIAVIVTMAVPAFNLIRGTRSVDSAQNQLNAIIGRAREEAVGMQDYRGVLLFQDPNNARTVAAEVYFPDPNNPTVLGLVPNREETLLPIGISFRMIENSGTYSAMNLVMFNSSGQFISQSWAIPQSLGQSQGNPIAAPTSPVSPFTLATTQLVWRISNVPWLDGTWPAGTTPSKGNVQGTSAFVDSSAFGILLFSNEKDYQAALAASAANAAAYLNAKGVAFMVNRYNGTLIRSE